MTRWSAITRTRGRRSALAYGSRSTTAAEETTSTGSYTTSGDATVRIPPGPYRICRYFFNPVNARDVRMRVNQLTAGPEHT